MDLDVLANPRPNRYTGGGIYLEDKEGEYDVSYCQITGRKCASFIPRNSKSAWDCRECNIPMVAALCRISRIIGSKGVE